MSQAHNRVKWCLAKARKEIEECSKRGKRPTHRGLVEAMPSADAAKGHLDKAIHNLQATEYLKKGKFSDISASTLFYSMYHCFLAIAAKHGYESRNQTCTVAAVEWLIEEKKIILDKKFVDMLKTDGEEKNDLGAAIQLREEYTYGMDTTIKEERQIEELLDLSKGLLDATKDIIFGK